MPLGISESSIRGAYGAVDLGGVYKQIESGVRRLAAEEKMYRQEHLKTYLQDSAKVQESAKGARAGDIADIMTHRKNWQRYKMLQDSDPLLIENDPKSYMALQEKIDEEYASAINLSKQSQDWAKEEQRIFTEMGQKPEMYDEGARSRWQKDVMGKSFREVTKAGLGDLDKYTNKTPDFDKMLDAYHKDVKPATLLLGEKEVNPTNPRESRQVKYHNMPVYKEYADEAARILSSKGTHNAAAYGTKLLQGVTDADFKDVVTRFNAIKNEGTKKSKLGIHDNIAQDEYATVDKNSEVSVYGSAATAAKYMAMKQFLNHYDKVSVEEPEYKYSSESEKMQASSNLAEGRADRAFARRMKQLGLTNTGGEIDIKPVFDNISRGGSTAQSQIKNLISGINSNPLVKADATMIGFNVSDGKKYGFSKEQDAYGNYKNSNKALANLDKDWSKLTNEQLAEKMNASNASNVGLVSTNITPQSIRTGKVMSFNWVDATGKPVQAFLDTQDPGSAEYLNKLLKSKVATKKQTAAAALGLTSDVEGAFDNIQ